MTVNLSLLIEYCHTLLPAESIRCFFAVLVLPLPLPRWARLGCAVSFGFLFSSWQISIFELSTSTVMREVVYGGLLVTPFALVIQTVRYAGEFFDAFRGHSLGRIVAPFSQQSRGVFSLLLEHAALGVLTAAGALVLIFMALAHSFEVLPLSGGKVVLVPLEALQVVLRMSVSLLTYAFLLVLPLGAIFLGVDLVFGVGSLIIGKVPLQQEASQVKNVMIVLLLSVLFSDGSLLGSIASSVEQVASSPDLLLDFMKLIGRAS